jgi:hypothetical protein
MKQGKQQMAVVLEVGKKRVFAIAQDWPGWCRSGSDEEAALQALFDYGPHYQRVLQASKIRFTAPKQLSNFVVVERIKGDATTDFGAPSRAWSEDTGPISPQELKRFQKILQACWVEFDKAVEDVRGKALRKGPRGGGRNLQKISEHVCDVDVAYLKSLGGKPKQREKLSLDHRLAEVREEILTTLGEAARGELPPHGPRGGIRWTPRYFVRRLAWHELDHAWEIRSRAEGDEAACHEQTFLTQAPALPGFLAKNGSFPD